MTVQELEKDALEKLREAEKAIHLWAGNLDVGPERNYAFSLYEIVRTAPREAQP